MNWLYGSRFAGVDHGTERYLFPGFLACLLAACALSSWVVCVARRRAAPTREIPRYMAILVVTLVLAFGPYQFLFDPIQPTALPYGFLYQVVPGMSEMQHQPQLGLEADLALAVLAGFGAVALSRQLGRLKWDWARPAVLAAIVGGVMLESWNQPIPMVPIETGSSLPPVYAWLHDQAPGVVVAEIPDGMVQDYRYEYFSTYDWHPRLNGTSGFSDHRPTIRSGNSWRTSRIRARWTT